MFLAHLVGDFVLQWDALAQWKSRELRGVAVHGLIVLVVTWLFSLPFDRTWWWGVLFISGAHFLIDVFQLYVKPRVSPLLRFTLDQLVHVLIILTALVAGGYLSWSSLIPDLVAAAAETPRLTALLGYAFITMPAWVLLKFAVYGLVKGTPPNFPAGPNKFVGIAERLAITTLVAFGQVLLVPLVTLPRLILEWPRVVQGGGDSVYVTELVASVLLAVTVGLSLRLLPM